MAHISSIVINSGGSMIGLFGQGGVFWGFSVYQSYLTYPLVLVFGAFLWRHEMPVKDKRFLVFILIVTLLEVILMRRVGLSLFLLFFMLYFARALFLFGVPVVFGTVLFGLVTNYEFTGVLEPMDIIFERMFSGEFTRAMTWERSIGYLSNTDTLWFGNGRNNYSHNWFLHTITTHGMLYSIALFGCVGYTIASFIIDVKFSLRPVVLLLAIVFVDWNLNVNLYQPYYAGMFALLLVSIKKSKDVDGRHSEKMTGLY
jgi:hypothetical protein